MQTWVNAQGDTRRRAAAVACLHFQDTIIYCHQQHLPLVGRMHFIHTSAPPQSAASASPTLLRQLCEVPADNSVPQPTPPSPTIKGRSMRAYIHHSASFTQPLAQPPTYLLRQLRNVRRQEAPCALLVHLGPGRHTIHRQHQAIGRAGEGHQAINVDAHERKLLLLQGRVSQQQHPGLCQQCAHHATCCL